ncbi:ABC transporter permease [Streptomyces sp. TRM66268-LWL]|uniref:ABC transporter permease n=2 Tax=Streptomyces polyasparticus TaxID=2767826 RepID=A0ABR7SFH9_9ACTN|nr:ABC transporter permease [Streptomyces polyasparticus]
MTGAVHAEWTKLRTLHSTWWLLLGIVLCTVGVGALTTGSLSAGDCLARRTCDEDTVKLSLTGVWVGQAAMAVFGVLAVTAEYGTGTMRVTLAAIPSRLRVLAAKAVVVAGLAAVVGAVSVLGSLYLGRVLVLDAGFTAEAGYPPIGLGDGATLRAVVGGVLYYVLVALLGVGLGAALRDTAGTLTGVFLLLYGFPLVAAMLSDPDWEKTAKRLSPTEAGLSVLATRNLEALPIGPWAGLGVAASWAVGVLVVGWAVLKGRDA